MSWKMELEFSSFVPREKLNSPGIWVYKDRGNKHDNCYIFIDLKYVVA